MSAKVVVCLWACLMAALPAISQESKEYLKLIELRAEVGDDGFIEFVGVVHNTHPSLSPLRANVLLTLKKDGIIIDLIGARCSKRNEPAAGEICEFSVKTKYTEDDYDSVSGRVRSTVFNKPGPELLTGELYLVEESLNVRSGGDGWVAIMGELHNGTNARLQISKLSFGLWDTKRNFLGLAETGSSFSTFNPQFQNIYPGENISFLATNEDVSFVKVDSVAMGLRYGIMEYILEDVATGIEAASWGQIKMGRK